jgi:hypothetical protein
MGAATPNSRVRRRLLALIVDRLLSSIQMSAVEIISHLLAVPSEEQPFAVATQKGSAI